MKGLKEYVKKHGMHFTEKLVYTVLGNPKWSLEEIKKELDKKVWYNLINANDWDILFLGNYFYGNKRDSINNARAFLQDYSIGGALGLLLYVWNHVRRIEPDFDFTPYI